MKGRVLDHVLPLFEELLGYHLHKDPVISKQVATVLSQLASDSN